MTQHTPGPWTPVTGQGAHHRDVYIRHGEKEADGSWPAVAKCCSSRVGSFGTVQANARLIAAAPALLAALEELLASAEAVEEETGRLMPGITAARSAIAQAKGENK